ncbi:MAG: anthranilate synthase component I family protein, partial [Chitinophagaceae bacterium]|nr:anthranilate synthase component I family protein [Chitinophagaceae bacterium]
MKKINMQTSCTKMLADIFTPVSIYLRLRDRFRDTVLLESTDYHAADNSYSFIGINAIGGIEIKSDKQVEQKFPGREPEKMELVKDADIAGLLWAYMQQFEITDSALPVAKFAQGLYGYTSFDAVHFFEKLDNNIEQPEIPLMRYRL